MSEEVGKSVSNSVSMATALLCASTTGLGSRHCDADPGWIGVSLPICPVDCKTQLFCDLE